MINLDYVSQLNVCSVTSEITTTTVADVSEIESPHPFAPDEKSVIFRGETQQWHELFLVRLGTESTAHIDGATHASSVCW